MFSAQAFQVRSLGWPRRYTAPERQPVDEFRSVDNSGYFATTPRSPSAPKTGSSMDE
jgi:hypothetical protein